MAEEAKAQITYPFDLLNAGVSTNQSESQEAIHMEDGPVCQASIRVDRAQKRLMAELTPQHRTELESIQRDDSDINAKQGPRLDTRLIQRYVFHRVFDLGWTIERFGEFDRLSMGYLDNYYGRSAHKPERMGKKYQWLAYHEILAHISDNFQYRGTYFDDEREYKGPWQLDIRDIDPSCTLGSTPGGTSWGSHEPAWWGKERYQAWREDSSHHEWLAETKDIPDIEQLLEVINPDDGTRWLNVDGSFVWQQPHPADQDPHEHPRRQLWIGITGYFVPKEESGFFHGMGKNC